MNMQPTVSENAAALLKIISENPSVQVAVDRLNATADALESLMDQSEKDQKARIEQCNKHVDEILRNYESAKLSLRWIAGFGMVLAFLLGLWISPILNFFFHAT